jgi:hypothetical protein
MTAEKHRARPKAHAGLFRYSAWDAIPATLIYVQFALVLAFAWAWPHMGWGARFACAALGLPAKPRGAHYD